jgi:hypothetical protein
MKITTETFSFDGKLIELSWALVMTDDEFINSV